MTGSINGLGYGGEDFYSYAAMQAAQAAAAKAQTQQTANTQAADTTFQGRQQPTTDTFERQGSSLGTNLALGGIAGAGTTAGMYFFGTKPVNSEGKLVDDFAKQFGNEYSSIVKQDAIADVLKKNGKLKPEILEEIRGLADGGKAADLSKEAKAYMKKYNISANKTGASKFVNGIDDAIGNIANPKDIAFQTKRLEGLQGLQEQLKGLPDQKSATLEKFIVDNAEDFGLKGKTEPQLKNEAKNLLNKYAPSEKVEQLLTKNAEKLGINFIDDKKLANEVKNIADTCKTPDEFKEFLKKNAKKLGLEGADKATTTTNIDAVLNANKKAKDIKTYLTTNAKKLGIDATDTAKVQAEIQKILTTNNTPAKLEAYLANNATHLGIKGKDAAEIAANAKKLAAQGNGSRTIERLLAQRVKVQEANVKSAEGIFDSVAKLWNKDKGALKTSSNKQIAAACEKGVKNFKWQKAGKWGAIAAAGTAIFAWAFSGNSQKA